MLAIKFRRQGKKHQASFRIIVSEKRSKLGGRFIDDLGWLDPKAKKFEVKKEKVEYWLKVGAKPTPSIHNLFVRAGIFSAPKIAVHKKSKKAAEGEPATAPAASAAVPEAAVPAVPRPEGAPLGEDSSEAGK